MKYLVLLTLSACATSAAPVPAYAPPPNAAQPTPSKPSQWNGRYSGDWGTIIVRIADDGSVSAAYSHDEGVVVGRLEGNTMVGRWCEAPSRVGPQDAGPVEFVFVNDQQGVRIDGRWKYDGALSEDWKTNWQVARDTNPEESDLVARISEAPTLCK